MVGLFTIALLVVSALVVSAPFFLADTTNQDFILKLFSRSKSANNTKDYEDLKKRVEKLERITSATWKR